MTNKVHKIIAEIKDRISNYQEYIDSGYDDEEVIKQEELKDLLTFIDSLQEEPKEYMYSKDNYTDEDRKTLCDGCEEECRFNKKEEPVSEEFEKALAEEWQGYVDRGAATVDALEDNTQELAFAKGFYRGAKWQKQQDQSTIELAEDHAMLAGMEKMKQQILKKAKEGVVTYDNYIKFADGTWIDLNTQMELLPAFDVKGGEKVKVIIIKEE